MSNEGANAQKMTLEERLVQHIKNTQLALLADDESALIELTKRALHEALYQQRKLGSGYHEKIEDSIVVTTAKSMAHDALTRIFQQEFDVLMEKREVRESVRRLMIEMIPNAIMGAIDQSMKADMSRRLWDAQNDLRAILVAPR